MVGTGAAAGIYRLAFNPATKQLYYLTYLL
jgi:hypothetical protein